MIQIRISRPEDIPRQRELWQLAFGDDGAYVDNFYNAYYQPERVLLLEEDGVVQAMTAWFETTFAVPGQGRYRAAYLRPGAGGWQGSCWPARTASSGSGTFRR